MNKEKPDMDTELLRVFGDELAESLDRLAQQFEGLLSEKADSSTATETAMHVAHKIKGAARIVGFDSIVELAHAMEDVLSELKDTAKRPPRLLVKQLLEGVTVLELLAAGRCDEEDASACARAIRSHLQRRQGSRRARPGESAAPRKR